MYAVIETGGKQFKVHEGEVIEVERLPESEGSEVEFTDVRLVRGPQQLLLGRPRVDGARVAGKVLSHGKGKKIIVYKVKRRKKYRRKLGHRQLFTRVRIDRIEVEQWAGNPKVEGTGETAQDSAEA